MELQLHSSVGGGQHGPADGVDRAAGRPGLPARAHREGSCQRHQQARQHLEALHFHLWFASSHIS